MYYPLESLPEIMQSLAKFLPTVHIFESMRSILIDKKLIINDLVVIIFLNLFYLILSISFFIKMIKIARDRGLLFNQGE